MPGWVLISFWDQIKAISYAKERGKITNRELQEIAGISRATATRELTTLLEMDLLEKHGTERGVHYTLKNASQLPHKCLNSRLINTLSYIS